MKTRTLEADSGRATELVDHLYLALAAGVVPGGTRWALDGIDQIEIGRGPTLDARRTASRLRIDNPDPWLSSVHIRFEREQAHWVVVDAGSRNGMVIDGTKRPRGVVQDHHVIEIGRSFFMLRTSESKRAAVSSPSTDLLATLDPDLEEQFADLRRIASADVPVLIAGPTGSGKERIAQAIHAGSRRAGPFVPVNCGALPAGLVESELFGHRRGAFSGAVGDHAGLVQFSTGGTLFLDEIGDLPLAAQAALLRVLEEHEVRPVGATTATRVDLRVVAASHRDLDELVRDGKFREDLLARLAGFGIELPALHERRVDLGVVLAEILPAKATMSSAFARALFAYAWPRNIRELVQTIDRAVALAGEAELSPQHLPEPIANASWPVATNEAGADRRDELVAMLVKHRGNVSRIADELGSARQQVQRWLKRYGLDPARYRE